MKDHGQPEDDTIKLIKASFAEDSLNHFGYLKKLFESNRVIPNTSETGKWFSSRTSRTIIAVLSPRRLRRGHVIIPKNTTFKNQLASNGTWRNTIVP